MLGEALLLYDSVALDLSTKSSLNVLATHIDSNTMEHLIGDGIIVPVYDLFAPIIAQQTKNTLNSIMIIDYNKNGIPPIDFEYMNKVLRPVYPKSIIDSIQKNSTPCNVDSDLLIENSAYDFKNTELITSIFDYVKNQFDLPEFIVEIGEGGCFFVPKTKNKLLAKRIIDEATYGLHLIANINYKTALLTQFDEIICESELENFFVKKLRQSYRNGQYSKQSENLIELCGIYEFPDIKELIASGMMSIKDVLKLRKNEGQFLRVWLNQATKECIDSNIPFSRELARLLIKSNNGMSLPTRTVIFGFLQMMSFIKPVETVLLSAANEYLMPNVLRKWQPKYFFDKARKLQVNNKFKSGNNSNPI